MNKDLLDAAYKLETASSLPKVWAVIVAAMASYKVNRIYYIVRDDGRVPNWFVLSNLPNEWPKQEARKPNFREPFVSTCCATFEPTKIGAEFFDQHREFIDDHTRDYVAGMRKFDWSIGLGFPCCLIGSGQHGGFLLGNNMNRHSFERSLVPIAGELQTFCLIAHKKIDALRHNKGKAEPRHRLSTREYQVLDCISKGLRPKAIAVQLSLSEASIRLYLKNARLKLGAATKEEALMRFLQEKQVYMPNQQ